MSDDDREGFDLGARRRSFTYAFRGLRALLASEHNTWIHATATAGVLVAGLAFGVSRIEWCCIALAVFAVWTAEAFNTAVELLGDATTHEQNPLVGRAKDVAAAAVLLAAAGAVVVGLLIFGPHLLALVG